MYSGHWKEIQKENCKDMSEYGVVLLKAQLVDKAMTMLFKKGVKDIVCT